MFSFAGDVVLDPFAGTGSTAVAAVAAGCHSVSVEIDSGYVRMAEDNIELLSNLVYDGLFMRRLCCP